MNPLHVNKDNSFKKNLYIFPKRNQLMKGVALFLSFLQTSLMSGLIKVGWTLPSASAFTLVTTPHVRATQANDILVLTAEIVLTTRIS